MNCDICHDMGRQRSAELVWSTFANGHPTFVAFCGEHEEQAHGRAKWLMGYGDKREVIKAVVSIQDGSEER